MNGCSHRVVTPTSRLAMPEVTIGLFPDVGASYFLNRLPGKIGLFLGLTGSHVQAVDALWLELADYALQTDQRQSMLEQLLTQIWNQGDNKAVITAVLSDLAVAAKPAFTEMAAPVQQHQVLIESLLADESVTGFVDRLGALSSDDPWLVRAQQTVSQGSPLSLCLIAEQLKRARQLSLKAVFQFEMLLAAQCCRQGEFAEGVRALLIDKDKAPKWRFASVESVTKDVLESHFQPPWTVNPLATL
nr:enoyl-CoA hydratase/isomerase family protein [Nitrincola sp. A-D6]